MSCNPRYLLYTTELDETDENLPIIRNLSTTQVCIADLGFVEEGSGASKKAPPHWAQTPSSFISSEISDINIKFLGKTFTDV